MDLTASPGQVMTAGDDSISPKPSQGQPVVPFIAEAGAECFTNRWFLVGHVPEIVVSLCWQINVQLWKYE